MDKKKNCAVVCIQNFYPPPGPEEDFVFEGFHYADEWLFFLPQLSISNLISLDIQDSVFFICAYVHVP